ncbi:hypothetical protein [Nocardioides sp. cx-173]|uniref:hypothetical protein n=1 Tax=Nocardioides sp. cx-173 TaxID=2898796 RepID=UPI001E50A19C|nr:hypothetical protein [Nocardioides sp. cx-173]MCD4524585.1 hypothetical protein [Nocardioides sp. cx-173]UGB42931.1 hypothetical protein LQ940_05260 [Nocardioides sp. cx-173]
MTRAAPRHAVRRTLATAASLAALATVGLVSGCSSASPSSPPAGVDELTVPTPSPDPDDFVDVIDNPWLPLAAGAQWSYDLADAPGGVRVRVTEETRTVAGVEATVVETVSTLSDAPSDAGWTTVDSTDYYAQDDAGNVWWLGREGEWQAGEAGAEAGIAMLATPRVGDGYAQAEPGPRAEVLALDGEVETPAGAFESLVVVETTEVGGRVLRSYYARGAGLVSLETETGAPEETLELTRSDLVAP